MHATLWPLRAAWLFAVLLLTPLPPRALVTANEDTVMLLSSFHKMSTKVHAEINRYNEQGLPISQRSLVIFHLGEVFSLKDSVDVSYNNLKIFLSAVRQDGPPHRSRHQAFYIISVVGGLQNPLIRYLPVELPNLAVVYWPKGAGEKDTPMRTVLQLGMGVLNNVSAVFVTSERSRGPMTGARNAEWLGSFRQLLDHNNVGVVGSSFSCEGKPHVQPHMYAMRASLVRDVVGAHKKNLLGLFRDGISLVATRAGYGLASLLYQSRSNQTQFLGQCLATNTPLMPTSNPTNWCNVLPQEVVFVKWGGVPLRYGGSLCEQHVQAVLERTEQLALEDAALVLRLPETHAAGLMYELRQQYNLDMWRSRDLLRLSEVENPPQQGDRNRDRDGSEARVISTVLARPVLFSAPYDPQGPQVCFFVRVGEKHLLGRVELLLNTHLEDFAVSLLRQTNPNWRAYLVNAHFNDSQRLGEMLHFSKRMTVLPKPLEGDSESPAGQLQQLAAMLRSNGSYIDKGKRVKWGPNGGLGGTETSNCVWGSVTSAGNIYGSGVVQSVLSAATEAPPPDLLLAPLDSKIYAEEERRTRQSLQPGPLTWKDMCVSHEAMFAAHLLPYTVQPNPFHGPIDLSAVFFRRDSLLREGESAVLGQGGAEKRSKEEGGGKEQCAGCEAGLLVQRLVQLGQHTRLPLDGFKSVVFHGPSPAYCAASGHLWFDLPDFAKAGCVTRKMLKMMQAADSKQKPFIDGKNQNSLHKICVRLSEEGFSNIDEIYFNQ